MIDTNIVQNAFFTHTDLDPATTEKYVTDVLHKMDDGELFLEYCHSESITFDDGVLRNASSDTSQGFGLRTILGETTGYAHASELSKSALLRGINTVSSIASNKKGNISVNTTPIGSNKQLYTSDNPLQALSFAEKVFLVTAIDTYVRRKEPLVKQVSVSLSGRWQVVHIVKSDGQTASDIRPLVRLNISVIVEKNGRMEKGGTGIGGRTLYHDVTQPDTWQAQADEALRQALVNVEAIPAPAGEMPVVLGPGWPGVLLHEAVGHGLEGDFNRKKSSAFSELMGKQVAAKGVTVIDDGTIPHRRGSITIDDEGTSSQKNVLIEDGILTGYMHDRLNGRLMGTGSTGNGRRESFEYQPLPRMTNTYMLSGDKSPEEIIGMVDKGVYAVNFSGGQVDITSGKFVFSASEAYLIENGKVTAPVKGMTLIGNGPDALTKIKAIGNDMEMDPGIGTCGKDGQGVPVGVGQPTLLIDPITVGGTQG